MIVDLWEVEKLVPRVPVTPGPSVHEWLPLVGLVLLMLTKTALGLVSLVLSPWSSATLSSDHSFPSGRQDQRWWGSCLVLPTWTRHLPHLSLNSSSLTEGFGRIFFNFHMIVSWKHKHSAGRNWSVLARAVHPGHCAPYIEQNVREI